MGRARLGRERGWVAAGQAGVERGETAAGSVGYRAELSGRETGRALGRVREEKGKGWAAGEGKKVCGLGWVLGGFRGLLFSFSNSNSNSN